MLFEPSNGVFPNIIAAVGLSALSAFIEDTNKSEV